MSETDFLKHLHSEKLKTQESRTNYTVKKLAYATTLLSLGSLNVDFSQVTAVGPINLGLLLYLAPWVALAFDLYILGEDYSVKRFGVFLRKNSTNSLEQEWEKWVSKNRDPFAPFAMPSLTTLILVGAAIIVWSGDSTVGPIFWIWGALTLLFAWTLYFYYRRLLGRTERDAGGEQDAEA